MDEDDQMAIKSTLSLADHLPGLVTLFDPHDSRGGRGGAQAGRGMVGASGTRYRPRARSRATSPTGVRPLRSADGPKGDGGGGNRHMRSDPSYQ